MKFTVKRALIATAIAVGLFVLSSMVFAQDTPRTPAEPRSAAIRRVVPPCFSRTIGREEPHFNWDAHPKTK